MPTQKETIADFVEDMKRAFTECGWNTTPKRSSITVVGLQPRNDEQWKWTQYVNSIPYTETQSIRKGADDETK